MEHALRLGLEHQQAGRLAEAEEIYRHILDHHPEQPDALHLMAMIARQRGQREPAMDFISRALRGAPDHAQMHCTLGLLQQESGQLPQAIAAYEKAIALQADLPEAHNNLAGILAGMGRSKLAIAHYRKAIGSRPDYAAAHFGLGNVLNQSGKLDEAVEFYRRTLSLLPDHLAAMNNLATVLCRMGRFDEAIAVCERAIKLRPDFVEAHNNLGNAYRGQRELDRAMDCHQKALAIHSDDPSAHWNSGLLHLMRGELQRGWPEYEWRWRVPELRLSRDARLDWWDGRDLQGRRILLHGEQGMGDTIQFIRYAPLIAARAGKVALLCQPELARLLGGVKGVEAIVPPGQHLPDVEVHCSLLSLPGIFNTGLADIPAKIPYLTARVKDIGHKPGTLKIGLCWEGNARHPNDRNRSMKLETLAALGGVRGAAYYSLQKGLVPPRVAELNLIDLSHEMDDFADTAAIVAGLDLVVTVDTAVAHLAGAMGKPVWMLLPFVPDWRWMLDRSDSPWYPSMRLFRQRSLGDWREPVGNVVDELMKEVASC